MLLFTLVSWKSKVSQHQLRARLAEEVKDAAVVIPWAMVVSYFLNAGNFASFSLPLVSSC